MDSETLAKRGVRCGMAVVDTPAGWQLKTFSGRMVELSGGPSTATLTMTFQLVLEAQKRGEPVAWITERASTFFPPDVVKIGIDLDAVAVVRVPSKRMASRAADQLVRSGGFGLVVLDLGRNVHIPIPIQSRLAGLAKKYHTALLFLTEKSSELPSVGALVSLRVEAARTCKVGDGFTCEVWTLKDKRAGTGWKHREVCHGPDGLC